MQERPELDQLLHDRFGITTGDLWRGCGPCPRLRRRGFGVGHPILRRRCIFVAAPRPLEAPVVSTREVVQE